jgi:hypothetical protein
MPSKALGKDNKISWFIFENLSNEDLGQRVEQKGGRGKCLFGFLECHASEPCPGGRALTAKGKLDSAYLEYHRGSGIARGAAGPQAITSTEHDHLFDQFND